ncbi:MAG TPA: YceI family protein [Gammaproteobacteria bacterium]|nr:YceI family protein [Gammaproteobacteria bacterium]
MKSFVKASLYIVISCLFALAGRPALADGVSYTLDPNHTQVQFNWSHLGFSHPGADFDTISGTLIWDATDIAHSSVSVRIPVASIHTHVPALDQKLKSAEFLDAGKFPEIRFISTKVEPVGSNHFRVTGNLTVHGVTRPAILDVTLNRSGMYPMLNVPALGFDASTVLKRSEFGVSEGIPFVGDDIRVRITSEALEAKGYARAMKALSASPKQ